MGKSEHAEQRASTTRPDIHAGTPDWARYAKARWGIKSWEIDPEIWERVMLRKVPALALSDIPDIIDWMIDVRGWKAPARPDDLAIGVLAWRKERKLSCQPEQSTVARCGLCVGGWLSWWPSLDFAGMTDADVVDSAMMARKESVPCLCDAGIAAYVRSKDYSEMPMEMVDEIGKVRAHAMRQASDVAKSWERLAAKEGIKAGVPRFTMRAADKTRAAW